METFARFSATTVLQRGGLEFTSSGKTHLQPVFLYFTFDTSTEFLYGQSVHSQAAIAGLDIPAKFSIDGAAFSHHFGAAKHLVDKRGALAKFYWLMAMKEMKKHCAEVHQIIDKMINDIMGNKKNLLSMKDKGSRKLVRLDELAEETQNPL
ncbi:uncharacterized protein RSE6_04025 [Rhynchosporium secalis]|uniref:Uncharacterized protein n=1 Tax=Rhynchosporium secalis TaxID=38038 RepID=A0A1E1M489_RHYSE|nr:uncharacterized protein RSE6_04025 [Rhynchosporium secalis]